MEDNKNSIFIGYSTNEKNEEVIISCYLRGNDDKRGNNMLYSIGSVFCIVLMVALVLSLTIKFLRLDRVGRIQFIKSFKKGKCAFFYLIAIPIFFMASLYSGKNIGISFFDSITKTVQLVVLKYDISIALISDNVYYAIAAFMCFGLAIVNAMMITMSLIHQWLWEKRKTNTFIKCKNEKCIIIGYNQKSKTIYNSCRCAKAIIGVFSKEDREKLYIDNIVFKSSDDKEQLFCWIENRLLNTFVKGKDHHKVNIIINSGDEQTDLLWCGKFVNFVNKLKEDRIPLIDIYVFGNERFENVYSKYEAKSRGCLHYLNEYQQIAIDFVDKFPLTQFMTQKQIDYEQAIINRDAEIRVAMIGYGKTNRQILLSMVTNNQFLTNDEKGKIVHKNVEYHLFDQTFTDNRNNSSYYQYAFLDHMADIDEKKYLPLPSLPYEEFHHNLDINDIRFLDELKKSISFQENSINYVIVSLGMDYASIDIANKIVEKLKEWSINNAHVFVRIRDKKTNLDSKIFLDLNICHPFGVDEEVVYNYSHIIQEKFSQMAMMRNFIYDIEHDMKHSVVTEDEMQKSRVKWFVKKSAMERESSVYCCLSLRNKLHLLGLDYCKKDDAFQIGLSEEEYWKIYAEGDKPEIVRDDNGKARAIRYSIEYKESRRKTMAVQEHARWNAFMILKGFVPASKHEILNGVNDAGQFTNGKSYAIHHHGNLTTFDGLVEFRKMIAQRDHRGEEECDVIKYDYQLLDGAWWLLDQNGFKIIKKQE